jgi:hypothetical protein
MRGRQPGLIRPMYCPDGCIAELLWYDSRSQLTSRAASVDLQM